MMSEHNTLLHIRVFHYWIQSLRVSKPNSKIYELKKLGIMDGEEY